MPQLRRDRLTSGVTTRRGLLAAAATCGLCGIASANEYLPFEPPKPFRFSTSAPDIIETVTPKAGVPTGIVFGDSIQRLIAAGVIDPGKLRAASKDLPRWAERVLSARSDNPIMFSEQTSSYLVDLLWPIGLANKAAFNEKSPIYTPGIPGFASNMSVALQKLGSDASKLQPLFITVDPQHDTRQVMADYLKSFDSRIIGLTGTQVQIDRVIKEYHLYVSRQKPDTGNGDYLVDHSAYIYLMNPQGKFVNVIQGSEGGEAIAAWLRKEMAQRIDEGALQ